MNGSGLAGFKHSVKVPTQYKKAAQIFKKSIEENKSVKTLIYDEKHAKTSVLLSLLSKYSNNKILIEKCIEDCKILEENPRFDGNLCRVLVTELLLGAKILNGDSKPVQVVRSYEKKLKNCLNENQNEQDLTKPTIIKPSYVRINTNLCSIEDAMKQMESEGWKQKSYLNDNYEEYIKAVREINESTDEFVVDIHLKEVLVFPRNCKSYLTEHHYTVERKFLLQDKATCLVSNLLNPSKNSIVLDMCAAPGMKTIHLSNLMKNKGTIYAVERDFRRFRTLTAMVEESGTKCVRLINEDVLDLKHLDCSDAQYILVDPSCSGSGMQNRLSLRNDNEEKDSKRLYKLAGLQIKILQHAMSSFPDATKIVYSTCSLYEEENEQVVQKCLERCPQWKLLNGRKALGGKNLWKNAGSNNYPNIGKNVLYAKPEDDLTDGIFIALFEKMKEENYVLC